MSVSTYASIIVGLPYTEMLKYFDKDTLDELIYNGDLDRGSIYYDSPLEQNIIGVFIVKTGSHTILHMEVLEEKCRTLEFLIPQLANAELKTYLTLFII